MSNAKDTTRYAQIQIQSYGCVRNRPRISHTLDFESTHIKQVCKHLCSNHVHIYMRPRHFLIQKYSPVLL